MFEVYACRWFNQKLETRNQKRLFPLWTLDPGLWTLDSGLLCDYNLIHVIPTIAATKIANPAVTNLVWILYPVR
jgi:hypothetical protein